MLPGPGVLACTLLACVLVTHILQPCIALPAPQTPPGLIQARQGELASALQAQQPPRLAAPCSPTPPNAALQHHPCRNEQQPKHTLAQSGPGRNGSPAPLAGGLGRQPGSCTKAPPTDGAAAAPVSADGVGAAAEDDEDNTIGKCKSPVRERRCALPWFKGLQQPALEGQGPSEPKRPIQFEVGASHKHSRSSSSSSRSSSIPKHALAAYSSMNSCFHHWCAAIVRLAWSVDCCLNVLPPACAQHDEQGGARSGLLFCLLQAAGAMGNAGGHDYFALHAIACLGHACRPGGGSVMAPGSLTLLQPSTTTTTTSTSRSP